MKRATIVVIALAGVLLAGGAGLVAKRMRAPAAEPASSGNNTRDLRKGANLDMLGANDRLRHLDVVDLQALALTAMRRDENRRLRVCCLAGICTFTLSLCKLTELYVTSV
jgi:hypothetical protein